MFLSSEVLGRSDPIPDGSCIAYCSYGRTRYELYTPPQFKATVVLVSGYQFDSSSFIPLFEHLKNSKKFQVIRFDLYGRGWSESPNVPHTDSLYLSQASELLFQLNINGPLIVVGWCYGCQLAGRFAAVHHSKVLGVVALGGKMIPPPVMKKTNLAVFLSFMFVWVTYPFFKYLLMRPILKYLVGHNSFGRAQHVNKYEKYLQQQILPNPALSRTLFSAHYGKYLCDIPQHLSPAVIIQKLNRLKVLTIMGTRDKLSNEGLFEYHMKMLGGSIKKVSGAHHSLFDEPFKSETLSHIDDFFTSLVCT